ncbi:hypothetical protein CEP54_014330 [Fusarium duplospermum]|uniref:Uncharacterized protein n=1 Tax=Fusarium duplospermum TaxID=1325734 RepID=A0A428NX22_9HYPO|nr:hypothetical protein CEP54_014330 [Fusarium duplospermum]
MAPSKGKEKKGKPASSAESVKKTKSKNELQQQLAKKQASLERASAAYDKASPEKKRQIDGMRNEAIALRAAIESMDVDPRGQEPNEKGDTLQDNTGLEGTNENDGAPPSTGPPSGIGTSSFQNDGGTNAPGNLGGGGENESGHEPGAADDEGQLPEPERDGAVPGVMPSIETDEPNGSLFLQDDDQTTEFEDPEYGKPLLTIPTTSGVSEEGVKTVGWFGKHLRKYINMYGKKNSATYRLENRAFPRSYAENPPEDENVGSAKNRFGDTLPGIGRLHYPDAEAPRIWGVAWRGLNSGDLEDDLELIDPGCNESFTHTVTYVLVGWTMNEKEEKRWETRTAYRNIIGSKSLADIHIYRAAVESQHRYIEAMEGRRRAISRSPSVPLLVGDPNMARGGTRPSRRTGKSSRSRGGLSQSDRGSSPAQFLPSPRSTVSPPRRTKGIANLREAKAAFIEDWLELRDAEDLSKLSPADQQQCVEAWRIHKSKTLT